MAGYLITMGDDNPTLELPDNLSMAIDYMRSTIAELDLPSWRRTALLQQAENMPRAGFSFAADGIGLVKVERV